MLQSRTVLIGAVLVESLHRSRIVSCPIRGFNLRLQKKTSDLKLLISVESLAS